MSSSNPGDVILDPFFGTGTTGAVAKKLHRHWIGIERDDIYVQLAQARLEAIQPGHFNEEIFSSLNKRDQPRIPFGALLENGLLKPGQKLYFGQKGNIEATVLANGQLNHNGVTGSIHQVGRAIRQAPCNGWEHWYYLDPETKQRVVIDKLREFIRQKNQQPAVPNQRPKDSFNPSKFT
jgi:modification methylase